MSNSKKLSQTSAQTSVASKFRKNGEPFVIEDQGDANLKGFQEIFLDDDHENPGRNSSDISSSASKTSLILPLRNSLNADNDSYTSLTPVNEVQSFTPNDCNSSLVRTSLSLTSDSSTPKLEIRKISNTCSRDSYNAGMKKSSTSNTLKTGDDSSDEQNRPKIKRQERFCYNSVDVSVAVSRCQCPECFEIHDRTSTLDT